MLTAGINSDVRIVLCMRPARKAQKRVMKARRKPTAGLEVGGAKGAGMPRSCPHPTADTSICKQIRDSGLSSPMSKRPRPCHPLVSMQYGPWWKGQGLTEVRRRGVVEGGRRVIVRVDSIISVNIPPKAKKGKPWTAMLPPAKKSQASGSTAQRCPFVLHRRGFPPPSSGPSACKHVLCERQSPEMWASSRAADEEGFSGAEGGVLTCRE